MYEARFGTMDVNFLESVSIKTILSNLGGFSKSLGIIFGGLIVLILERAIRKELETTYPDYME